MYAGARADQEHRPEIGMAERMGIEAVDQDRLDREKAQPEENFLEKVGAAASSEKVGSRSLRVQTVTKALTPRESGLRNSTFDSSH